MNDKVDLISRFALHISKTSSQISQSASQAEELVDDDFDDEAYIAELLTDFPEILATQSVAELEAEFNKLSFDERMEISESFRDACIYGGREPSDYWYPLLMPCSLEGYVGD